MDVKINPAQDLWSDPTTRPQVTEDATGSDTAGQESHSDDAVDLDGIPAVPPAEVMDAISVAAQAPERLAADGKELRFELDRPTGKVRVQVHDLDGNIIDEVPPSTALDVAEGADIN